MCYWIKMRLLQKEVARNIFGYKWQKTTKFNPVNFEQRYLFGDLEVDERIIIKRIIER
jgi:hypothetical protein